MLVEQFLFINIQYNNKMIQLHALRKQLTAWQEWGQTSVREEALCWQLQWRKRESRSASDWACRGGVGGCQTVTPTQLHRTVSTGLNSWEPSRSPSCCCCVLLQKPHMEPHVTASTTRRIYTGGAQRAHELLLHGWQWDTIRGKMRTGTHTFFFFFPTHKQQLNEHWNTRDVEMNMSHAVLHGTCFFCVPVATQGPVCVFVRKVTTALWLMLTRGSLLKGGMSNQSHSCWTVRAGAAHMQRQTRSGKCSCVIYFALWAAAWLTFATNCKSDIARMIFCIDTLFL